MKSLNNFNFFYYIASWVWVIHIFYWKLNLKVYIHILDYVQQFVSATYNTNSNENDCSCSANGGATVW